MTTTFTIDAESGAVRLGGTTLGTGTAQAEVEHRLPHLVRSSRDMRTGYVWLDLADITFGGQPATASLCFHQGRLWGVDWSVALPDAEKAPEGWPTRESIDREVAFVRSILARDIGFDPRSTHPMEFEWGGVVSIYDDRSYMAANRLRYRDV